MAATVTAQQLIDYYVNLLIIQYHDQPKAQATIALIAQNLLADGVYLDVLNGYALDSGQDVWDLPGDRWDRPGDFWDQNTGVVGAVGVQLDVIGKYVGVDRFYRELDLEDYFAFVTYNEPDPDSEPKFGFSTYATFGDFDHNGTLFYNEIISQNNRLFDDSFRIIIALGILNNTSNASHKSIDDGVFSFFGTDIRPESAGGMRMVYFITSTFTPLLKAVLFKKLLPKPEGVGLLIVSGITGLIFGFTGYDGYQSPFGFGFSQYATYDSLQGEILTYDMITQG